VTARLQTIFPHPADTRTATAYIGVVPFFDALESPLASAISNKVVFISVSADNSRSLECEA